jgi:hydrogenase large subunit
MTRRTVNIDLNRVEGDLEFQLELEGNTVIDARCIGTLYRGFEQIMVGREPKDSLVITPRVCGICGTAHLYAAVQALEQLAHVPVTEHAALIRNLCLLAENTQSDLRQSFLFFMPDLCNARYAGLQQADALQRAFAPLQGSVVRGALEASRQLTGIVAQFGGQWPHSSYMLPGGVTTPATPRRLLACRDLVEKTIAWVEKDLLADTLDNWLAIPDAATLWQWLAVPACADSAMGLFIRTSRQIGLHQLGKGSTQMLSYGASQTDAETRQLRSLAGVYLGQHNEIQPLDQRKINEHVRYSWFLDYPGGKHPWQGETIPHYQSTPAGQETGKYTWTKAPRYGTAVMQTGPLAERLVDGDALLTDLFRQEGDNTWLRQFARLHRACHSLLMMREILRQLPQKMDQAHLIDPEITHWPDGESYGLVQAARGALGHWLRVRDGKIEKYQIVTPTSWNASPRDSEGQHGHWEQSVIGVTLQDPDDPLEIGHIVRSHDPCLVCTVHFAQTRRKIRFGV